ncbi:MAG: hypothetical protein OZSIB_1888 [Candidatus Ozemobacter sibiricus]|jgi:hypothetical protein|uniref:Uncharacterized protein n=1 Tax=Candidatus Ozemobacter sibiricus TaxID=2268124 RepID=A0A367ZJR7_9BACT|nr:MAG: hypothetical protein OZSIB_1888 [Candidatus Ozemobacter sibiricus]
MTTNDGSKPAAPASDQTRHPPATGSSTGDTILTMAEGRPGENDPVSPSVPRAGPGLRVNPQVEAVLAQAQAALLQGDAQKAAELFAEATRLGAAAAADTPPSPATGKPDAAPPEGA